MGKMKTLLEDYYINNNFYEDYYINKGDEYLFQQWLEQEEANRIAEIKSNRLQKINDLLNEKED